MRDVTPLKGCRVDKTSRVPIYLQLIDFVRFAVSTGAVRNGAQLPGVVELGARLGINFETVRKAYKALESEGLIQMHRGRGTFVGPAAPSIPSRKALIAPPEIVLRDAVLHALTCGLTPDKTREVVDRILLDSRTKQYLFFTECNTYEIDKIAAFLQDHLGVEVRGILLADLSAELARKQGSEAPVVVITTGFHLRDAREIVAGSGVEVEAVVTNMSPETRRELEKYPKDTRFGFVCRDDHSVQFYREMLKAELGLIHELQGAAFGDGEHMDTLFEQIDVVLTSPPVYREVSTLAGTRLPVFNVLDRVDPVSLLAIRERLFREWRPAGYPADKPA